MTYGLGGPVKVYMNGEIIDLIPVRAAHTGGDTMVRFENADVIMIGDFYRNYGYPFIDTNNGGTLKGALDALELTMKVAGPNTRLVPGHGTIINRTDIVPYRDMILGVEAKVRGMIGEGKSLQEVLAAKVTAPYDAKVPGGLLPAGGGTVRAGQILAHDHRPGIKGFRHHRADLLRVHRAPAESMLPRRRRARPSGR